MSSRTSVVPIKEVSTQLSEDEELVFQRALYRYAGGGSDQYYRFMRRKNGKLMAQRGQCGIPDLKIAQTLIKKMYDLEHGEDHG